MTTIRSISFALVTGMFLSLGACDADPAQFAQCHFDVDGDGNVLKTSSDCNPGDSCQSFDGGPGLQGMLCNSTVNPCGPNSAATMRCQTKNQECRIITLTDGTKGTMCVSPDPICANNGNCPTGTNCVPLSATEKACEPPTPTGTCSKHSDCTDAQFCNFAIGKCTDDNKVDGACNVGSTNMSLGTATPEQCTTNRCNSDLKCGCNVTADCVAAGFTGLICSNANKCVVDPTTINDDWTEACFTIPGGGTPVVFHSDAAGGLAYTAGTYKGASTTPNCITLKRVIDGSISVPLTSATKGEGPVTAANVYQLPADKRIPGIQLQVCNGSNLADPKCYPGVESGRSFTNEVTLVTFRGLGANKLPLTTFDVKSAIWLQLTGTTSASGNPSVQKASYSKP